MTAYSPAYPLPESIGREGIVTVFDRDGLYLGCMGIETWKTLLRREIARKPLTPPPGSEYCDGWWAVTDEYTP